MKGIVKHINPKNGFCAIEIENHNFIIFDDYDGKLSIGDIVIGEFKGLGNESFFNESSKDYVEGFIENLNCRSNQIETLLKN